MHPSSRGPVPRVWKIWLPIPILLLLLDATFNLYFWRIPKLSGPDGDWGYQFLIDVSRAAAPKAEGSKRVVAFGSSVSVSFDPWQVGGLLEATAPEGQTVEVHRLMLPGVHPADYRLLWAGEAERIRPDVAVIMVNLLDLLSSSNPRDMNPTLLAALPPWRVLAERGWQLSPTEQLDWLTRGMSRLYRYAKPARSALQDHARFAAQSLRARSVSAYGIYPDGYTRPRFGVPLPGGRGTAFEYFISPAWIAQRGVARLTFWSGDQMLREVRETQPGWKRVSLEIPTGTHQLLEVSADGFWNPRAAGEGEDTRLLGVRLREVPPGDSSQKAPPLRYPPHAPSEIHELLRLGGARGEELERRWNAMVNADNRFGRRLRAYREEKVGIHRLPFAKTAEYVELERLIRVLVDVGATVLVINTPESPWLLQEYQDAEYYRRYLDFFAGLRRADGKVRFLDLRDALPVEDFNDWHHPSYIGSIKLGPTFAAAVREALPAAPAPVAAAGS